MDRIIKEKVLQWLDYKIIDGETQFDVDSCIIDIGLDPLNKKDYDHVEEVFIWHQNLINDIYHICFEKNT